MNTSDVIKTNPLVLLSFGADWCDECRSVKPVVEEVIKNFFGKVSLYRIDTDKNIELAKENQVFSLPTLLLMKNGKEVWRMNGVATAANLMMVLEKHVKANA